MGDISPELSLVSTIFSSLNFPPPEPIYRRYSYVLFIAISLRGGTPLLSFLYLQIHNYFFPFSKYLSCAIFSFLKSTINSFHLVFLALSLGEMSPNKTMFLVYSLGEISPDLCSLYLQMYDYFFPFSDIHICYLYPFHWRGGGEISSHLKLSIYANSQLFPSIFIIFIMCCF